MPRELLAQRRRATSSTGATGSTRPELVRLARPRRHGPPSGTGDTGCHGCDWCSTWCKKTTGDTGCHPVRREQPAPPERRVQLARRGSRRYRRHGLYRCDGCDGCNWPTVAQERPGQLGRPVIPVRRVPPGATEQPARPECHKELLAQQGPPVRRGHRCHRCDWLNWVDR